MNEETIHIDRTAVMNKVVVDFPKAYDQAIINIEKGFGIHSVPDLASRLKAKRDFGFKKYGEKSFQGSFENAIATPSWDDLQEELIDAINYLLHIQFKERFESISDDESSKLLYDVLNIYIRAQKLQQYRKERAE